MGRVRALIAGCGLLVGMAASAQAGAQVVARGGEPREPLSAVATQASAKRASAARVQEAILRAYARGDLVAVFGLRAEYARLMREAAAAEGAGRS